MESYTSIYSTPAQLKTKRMILVFSLCTLVASVILISLPIIVISLLLIYLCFYKKHVTIDDKAVTTHYNYLITKSNVSYSLNEYTNIMIDKDRSIPKMAFVRNGISSYAYFNTEDLEPIIALFEASNPGIHVQYMKLNRIFS